jgi:RNase P/RNase MRP subunit p29
MRMKNLLLSLTLILLCAGISSAASKMWVHVHVEDTAKEETVKINLPISVIETMLPIIQEKQIEKGHINFNNSDLRVEDLRKVWNEIRDEGDMEFVSIQNRDGNVRIYVEGNFLLVQPEEKSKNGKVDIRIPLKVVDAMLSGKGNELNLTAAVKALRDSGVKDIITVRDKDSSVRVWIDDKNQAK